MLESFNNKECLGHAIQSKLRHHGHSALPSDIKEQIETVASREEAFLILDKFIKKFENNNQAFW